MATALGRVDLSTDVTFEHQPGREWALNTWWQEDHGGGQKHKRSCGSRRWGWGFGESACGWSHGWTWVRSTCLLNREVWAGWSAHPLSPRWALCRVRAPEVRLDSVMLLRLQRVSPPSAGEQVGRTAVCARLQAEARVGWGGDRKDMGQVVPPRCKHFNDAY